MNMERTDQNYYNELERAATVPKDERIKFLESEVERLKSGLDDIEKIVFADRLRREIGE